MNLSAAADTNDQHGPVGAILIPLLRALKRNSGSCADQLDIGGRNDRPLSRDRRCRRQRLCRYSCSDRVPGGRPILT
jgi:hypothetical protein